jgi:hypothetical protein
MFPIEQLEKTKTLGRVFLRDPTGCLWNDMADQENWHRERSGMSAEELRDQLEMRAANDRLQVLRWDSDVIGAAHQQRFFENRDGDFRVPVDEETSSDSDGEMEIDVDPGAIAGPGTVAGSEGAAELEQGQYTVSVLSCYCAADP